jgi:hypothetical protein
VFEASPTVTPTIKGILSGKDKFLIKQKSG